MSLHLLLHCTDLEETRDFYALLPHCTPMESAQNTLTVHLYGAKLIFTSQDLWEAKPILTGTLYFDVQQVDQLFDHLKDHHQIAWPLQMMDYGGQEFAIRDCNGYLLAFRQV